MKLFPVDEAMKLLAAVEFFDDPLNLSRAIPSWAWDLICDCPPECTHRPNCPMYTSWNQTVIDLAFNPHGELSWTCWPNLWRWVCSGVDGYHTGGEINGPLHWCERERRLVTNDD